jgi:hypothetical protein
MSWERTKRLALVDNVAQDTIVDDYELYIRADANNAITVLLKMKPNDISDTVFGVIAAEIPAGQLWVASSRLVRGDLQVTGGNAYAVLRY